MKTKLGIREHLHEEIVELQLTHNLPDETRRFLGEVDFYSPSQAMVEKEADGDDEADAIREDAEDCARKISFLLIAKRASGESGIHRENAVAGPRILAAVKFHCEGETLEAIGKILCKNNRQVISRYVERFISWSAENCEELLNITSPDDLLDICRKESSRTRSVAEILDSLRMALSDLLQDLLEAAVSPEFQGREVYEDPSRFLNTNEIPAGVIELLRAG